MALHSPRCKRGAARPQTPGDLVTPLETLAVGFVLGFVGGFMGSMMHRALDRLSQRRARKRAEREYREFCRKLY